MRAMNCSPRAGGSQAARALFCALLLALLASGPVRAGNQKSWNKGLQEALAHLRAQQWEAAEKRAQRVLDSMIEDMAPGKAAEESVGRMLLIRALAEAGGGDEAAAAWDWQLAQQFDAQLERLDLSEFGAAGAMLDRHRLKNDPVPEALKFRSEAGMTHPERVSTPPPRYSDSMRQLRQEGFVRVEVIVHEDGSLSHPRIVERPPWATMVLVTTEAMKRWQFRPAQLDGQPVRVRYIFVTGFGLSP